MNKEQLKEYKKKISELSEKEKILRDKYLRKLSKGEIQGPLTGYPSIDKPWLKYYEENQFDFILPKMNAYDFILKNNEDRMDSYAINFYGNRIKYKELRDEYVPKVKKAFIQMGIKKGDYVTFCTPTLPETIYCFCALRDIGAVCNFIDLRMNKERILEFINNTNSKLVVSFNGVSDKVYKILHDSTAKALIDIDVTDSLKGIKKNLYNLKVKNRFKCDQEDTYSWKDFINEGKKLKKEDLNSNKFEKYDPNAPAAIVYTGGTSGEPKGAVLTDASLILPCLQYGLADIPRGYNDKFINIMPPFIAYGLVNGIELPLSLGMECTLLPKFDPTEFSQILKKSKPEHFVGIPIHYEVLMADKRCEGLDLSFIKNAGCGGDTIPEKLEKDVNQFLKDHNCSYMMRCGFGMTENAAMSIYDINNEMTKEGRIGIPMQKMNIGVFDKDGNELGYNQTGELYINSPSIIKGYFNNDKKTKETIININGQRWIKTKDEAEIDKDGNVKIIGRKKTMLIRPDGHNVWPDVIRNALYGCPIIKDLCVIGIKSKYNNSGVIPTAIVVLKDKNMDKEEAKNIILEYQSHLLGERDGVIDIRFRDSLPLTPIGKIDSINLTKKENENLSDIDFDVLTNNKKKVLKQ